MGRNIEVWKTDETKVDQMGIKSGESDRLIVVWARESRVHAPCFQQGRRRGRRDKRAGGMDICRIERLNDIYKPYLPA
jgi:hypothetical protein